MIDVMLHDIYIFMYFLYIRIFFKSTANTESYCNGNLIKMEKIFH